MRKIFSCSGKKYISTLPAVLLAMVVILIIILFSGYQLQAENEEADSQTEEIEEMIEQMQIDPENLEELEDLDSEELDLDSLENGSISPEELMQIRDPFSDPDASEEEIEEEPPEEPQIEEDEIVPPEFTLLGYTHLAGRYLLAVWHQGEAELLASGDSLAGFAFREWRDDRAVFEKEGETFYLSTGE
ncbi:hypothetical protein [Halarsenatibacter silvermanii]|uniref:Uncharacterized protein n=1 Tax=Halarsenatibacter silvermanii TaxID=321763 RepID=A0A1G9LB66_9FIRM|nr:hypothetical protein [Halarsenatibacter silvermanii]SDL59076.1 hypothetical protein SAMN04488692_10611 [Halarsenatibacter silvermanii]